MDERARAERTIWGDAEARATVVRWLMAECRARLAAEDAARAVADNEQATAGDLVEQPPAD